MKTKLFLKISSFILLLSSMGFLTGCVGYQTYPNNGYNYQYSSTIYRGSYYDCYNCDSIWRGGVYYPRYRNYNRENSWNNNHNNYNGNYHNGNGGYHGNNNYHGGNNFNNHGNGRSH